jgi:hypothetical protein
LLYDKRPSQIEERQVSGYDGGVPCSPAEERLLRRALDCALEEFIARFGAKDAIKRVEAELLRAKRARSRKLYGFWSAILAQIEADSKRRSDLGP